MPHPAIQALRLSPAALSDRITARVQDTMRARPGSPERRARWAEAQTLSMVRVATWAALKRAAMLRAARAR